MQINCFLRKKIKFQTCVTNCNIIQAVPENSLFKKKFYLINEEGLGTCIKKNPWKVHYDEAHSTQRLYLALYRPKIVLLRLKIT